MRAHDKIPSTTGCFVPNGSHRIWSQMISALTLTVIAGVFVACSMGYGELSPSENHQAQTKRTGRTLLVDNQAETAGYGLYSYVLFASPPTAQTKPLYIAIISACLTEFPDLGRLTPEHSSESLNVIHLPVRRNISAPRAEEILEYYSYERAQTILGQFSRIQKNGGPYLLSSLAPVSDSHRYSPSLYQDLSAVYLVSNPGAHTDIAKDWVLSFVEQVNRPKVWDRATLATFTDEILGKIQPVFISRGVSADKLDLKKYIVFPIPDNRTERALIFQARNTRLNEGNPNHINVLD
ncbi:hypothetical protein [Candidatus Nitrospira nitrosa]|uniref:hypothetical protein n=1 Tax=Candidatus Nitrospira nitrosa TaxID=1742972 RepID=UPI000AFEEB1B|nr:hypothetical protein [Candidatus Nitrospira nitrosa]